MAHKISAFTDLVYDDHERCRLDLFRPSAGDMQPLVLLIHGGGWAAGHRMQYHQLCIRLAEEGFAAAAVGYRLVPDAVWPEIGRDCARAAAHVCRNAAELGVDASRAATWGSSAGGHLALMLQAWGSRWLKEGVVDRLPDIVGTVAQCPAVFVAEEGPGEHGRRMANGYPPEEVSPHHVPADLFRSVLVVHGDADKTLPLARSADFIARLSDAGIDARLEVLPGAEHGFGYNLLSSHARKCVDFALPYLRRLLAPGG
ncbi:MAG: alpha/beta hydrolase [Planctomycetes bacterium]|nr:alpha/beta hydrolase [Planctomycetota bacterium]